MLEVTCWSAATGSSSTSFRDLSVSDHAHSDAANMPAGVLVTDGMVPAGLAGLAIHRCAAKAGHTLNRGPNMVGGTRLNVVVTLGESRANGFVLIPSLGFRRPEMSRGAATVCFPTAPPKPDYI